jgi:Ca2+-binding EF-hand superfamily protein
MGYLWISTAALLVLQHAAVTQAVPRAEYLKVMDGEFKQLDANGDGKVTAQEVTARQTQDEKAQALALNRKIFTQLDKDKNGSLSPEEFAALVGNPPPIDPRPFMQRMDLDKDKNGSLSPEEFAALVGNPPPIDPRPFMQRMDLDKDGVVTLVEHRTVMLATFDAIDADKDGIVTPAEMQAYQQRQRAPQPPPAKR